MFKLKNNYAKLTLLIMIVSSNSILASDFNLIDDIDNINLDLFCKKELQYEKKQGRKTSIGCLDENGHLDKITIGKKDGKLISAYFHGKNGLYRKYIYGSEPFARRVSLLSLIVTPEKYEGKRVRLKGFYYYNKRGRNYGLTKDHWTPHIHSFKDMILVKFPRYFTDRIINDGKNKYVTIEGIFTMKFDANRQYGGLLKDLTSFHPAHVSPLLDPIQKGEKGSVPLIGNHIQPTDQ